MRCSICLSEMKEGPDGLECVACGTLLEPLEDDADIANASDGKLTRDTLIKIAAGAVVSVAIFVWAIVTFAPERDVAPEALTQADVATNAQTLIRSDEGGIVAGALQMPEQDSTASLLIDKGCQRIAGEGVETIQWLNLSGEALNTIRPAFPGNWRIHEICPMERGGAAIATLLNDGVALSYVGERGDLLWTQIVSAKDPIPDQTVLVEEDQDLLLVARDPEVGAIQLSSFAPSGAENWTQSLPAGNAMETVSVSKTSLGDLLIAWREPTAGIRLVIVSTTGLVIQDLALDDRLLPLKGAVQDEIGRTLLLLGDEQVGIELLAQTGLSERQRSLASSASPTAVMTYEDTFLIFAHTQSSLMVWGMDALGNISDLAEVETDAEIERGRAQRMNEVEAVLSLQTLDKGPIELVIDLRRVSNALEYPASDTAFDVSALSELAPNPELETPSALPVDVVSSPAETAPTTLEVAPTNEVSATRVDLDPSVDVSASDTVLESPSIPASETASLQTAAPQTPNTIETGQDEEAIAETPPDPETSSVFLPADPSQARCTFSCISTGEPAVEYVLMQSVDRSEGESLTDVSLRLNDTHVNLCALSGGEPEPSFRRQCTAG